MTDNHIPASAKRRLEAIRQGHVARSADLVTALVLLTASVGLWITGADNAQQIADLSRAQFSEFATEPASISSISDRANGFVKGLATLGLPFAGLILAIAFISNVGQIGFRINPNRVAANFNILSPAHGAKNLVTGRSVLSAAMMVLKVCMVVGMISWVSYSRLDSIMGAGYLPITDLAGLVGDLVVTMLIHIAAGLLVLAAGDYAWQRLSFERQLRMTPEQQREEAKEQTRQPRTARQS